MCTCSIQLGELIETRPIIRYLPGRVNCVFTPYNDENRVQPTRLISFDKVDCELFRSNPMPASSAKDPLPIFAHSYHMGRYRATPAVIYEDPHEYDIPVRTISFNANYMRTQRGLLKIFQIILCFTALLLVGSSYGVQGERGWSLLVSFCGFVVSFALLIANVLTLNTKVNQIRWFLLEITYYVIMTLALFLAALFMAALCANFWAEHNPKWQIVPALAAGVLFGCTIVFAVDMCVQVARWRRWKWNPTVPHSSTIKPQTDTDVLSTL
ncbi:unnamed protein product [Toxocara canis]|uniref:MARVEL domain-containing protein n=1 Tax=Toxocara canis TaxID=6265 RepID=A0A183UBX7_TOXCA|nr:unnamed protein product [Toxocara canis]